MIRSITAIPLSGTRFCPSLLSVAVVGPVVLLQRGTVTKAALTRESIYLGAGFSLRDLVHHRVELDSIQASTVLEKWLRATSWSSGTD